MKGNFMSFVKKESLHILRDRRTMLVVFLIPVILTMLFGFAISTEVNHVSVAAVASYRTEKIEALMDRIARNSYFNFYGYIPIEEVDRCLRTGEVTQVVIFDGEYDRKEMLASQGLPSLPRIEIITDASDPNTATAASMYLRNILADPSDHQSLFETRMLFNPQMRSAYNFVPGIMGMIFILVCALMTSVSIVREKETGTMEVLLVSPVNPVKIVFSKMIPYFVISCLILAIILLISRWVLDVPMSGGIVGIVCISILYLVLALSLGLFVSNLASSQVVAMLISVAVMLFPIIMFSGMLFPIENMPKVFQVFSCVVPARWYIDAMRKMMIEGLSFAAVSKDVIILCFMTVLLIAGSIKKFNDKLE